MGKIFYIMGKSASGKDSIYEYLLARGDLGLNRIILYTTRPIRDGEEPGREYYFVDCKRYRQLEREGRIIESRSYNTVHGVWTYFTADDGQIDLSNHHYLGIGTLESYAKIKTYFGAENICPVYVEVEDGERLQRALDRERKQKEPKYAEMCRRFVADCQDFSEEKLKAARIEARFINDDRQTCLATIEKYVKDMLYCS
jgi:guanylate kinase